MKTLLTLVLLLLSFTVYSQKSMLFSGAVNAGIAAHGSNQIDPLFGIDLETRHNKFGLYLSANADLSLDSSGSRIYEFIIGPRWYIGNLKKINGSIETGFGDYIYVNDEVWGRNRFGINLGLGLNYPVSNKFNIGLKAKYHFYSGDYGKSKGDVFFSFRYSFN